ncbi:DUF742 domain-containing protein [Streptomonospora nanhaiensis]|uniref:DUF742 domain-containing protein n=1 Tax=Streptomonospora nanhaiensis TaxID=1323731 RepID=A0A853BVP8_9ACTN|nr:DUF742 domain-containing protein [Streptomonospora nanhaiensis]MBX9389837.1 DUF742 domain-containing protein [Streptomonospora nanhaiensis]NYI98856.1 hypothetical protein [Streptomonospora nanhaiensis]
MSGRPSAQESPGRLVRPFAIGLDSARGATGLDLLTRVAAARAPRPGDHLRPEREALLRLAEQPQSVAELSAHLGLPLSVTKLLITDMIEAGDLRACATAPALTGDDLLHVLLEGLRAL